MHYDLAAAVAPAAFWAFVAVCVICGAVSSVARNRETQKTIRQAIEKGETLDPATLERLLQGAARAPAPPAPQTRFGLIVGGIIMLCIGAGLAIMGWFIHLGQGTAPYAGPDPLYPMLGVGCLVGMIGVGLLIAAGFAGKSEGVRRG
jgi:hypothetical protein